MSEELSPFEKKLLEKEQALGGSAGTHDEPAISMTDFEDAIPDIELSARSPEDEALDAAIKNFSILDAYNKWCGKSRPRVGKGQKESIKVSCPNPQHPDRNPSAYMNLEKNVYHCGACSQGGDVWDIAAYHFGYPVPGYKSDAKQFRELREKIGTDLGFTVVRGLTKTFISVPGDDEDEDTSTAPNNVVVLPTAASVAANKEVEAREEPTIAWRDILPADTFLYEWMKATTVDTCPEEFHFWTGLMAVGFAVGLNRQLSHNPDVKGNLFVTFLGPSGTGKSRAKRYLSRIIDEVMPYDYERPETTTGTKWMSRTGSSEFIQQAFSAFFDDPSSPGRKIYVPVRAAFDFDEMAGLVTLAGRMGNPLKETLQEIYDCPPMFATGSMKTGSRVAKAPFGQVTSSTQHASIKGLFSRTDDGSGFLNRWVFATGRPKPRDPFGGPKVDLSEAAKLLRKIWNVSSTGQVIMEWDEETRPLWYDFDLNVIHPIQLASENKGTSILQRLDLLMMKLCLLFACNLNEKSITRPAFEQAKAMLPYLLKSYGALMEDLEVTEDSEQGDMIVEAITDLTVALGRAPSFREIQNRIGRRKIFPTKEVFRRQVEELSKAGVITEVDLPRTGKRGPQPTGWAVNE